MLIGYCYPLIFTRTKFVDYRLLVAPEFLKDNPLEEIIWDKVTSLCSVDGYRGDLVGRRWHILRLDNYVLFGMATDEFKRKDAGNRNIRGYYGLVFPKQYACELNLSKVDWKGLEERFVGSIFDTENTQTLYVSMRDEFFAKEIYSHARVHSRSFSWNTDKRYIGVIGSRKIKDEDYLFKMLYEALSLIDKEEHFELIVGLNNLRHAQELGTLNVVSYDNLEDGLYDLSTLKITAYGFYKFWQSLNFWGKR